MTDAQTRNQPANVDGFWYFTCAGRRPGQQTGTCGDVLRGDFPAHGAWTDYVTCPACGLTQRATWTLYKTLTDEQRAVLDESQAQLRARWQARETQPDS